MPVETPSVKLDEGTGLKSLGDGQAPSTPPARSRGWLDRIARLYRAEMRGLVAAHAHATPAEDRRRILIYSMIPWRQGCVEHILSTALRIRGHEVVSGVCGGMLPDCETHYYDFERPACSQCRRRARRFAKAFGIAPALSTDHLTESDLTEAERIVADLDEAALEGLVYDGVPVGKIARFEIHVFYQNYLVSLDAMQLEQFRTFCRSAILLTMAAARLLDRYRPDIAITCNGKAFTYRPFFLLARRRGIPVVTWEEHAFDDTLKFVFAHDSYANEIHLETAWQREKDRPLTPAQSGDLDAYFGRWQRGENTPFAYHRDTCRDSGFLYQALGIRPGAPVIACFPNMVRDTAAFDRDVAFPSLIDWLLQTVAFIRRRPEVHLVIRAHPAERCLPERYARYNRFFVCPEVRRHFSPVPPNVHLLEGDTAVSSYALMQAADGIQVYTSTIGIEAALQGRLACVIGDVHYRGKGFTRDMATPEDLWDFLRPGPPYPRTITTAQVELARRYAYLWRFRHPFAMPWYDPGTTSFDIPTFRALAPGGHVTLDKLCRCILTGEPFIDMETGPARHGMESST
ncbi:MAG: hypothetical protein AMXMBFR13_19120 [Phycisphaerae bacterium]